MQKKLFDAIMSQEDLEWQTMLHDLIKKEGMNPWDIDISLLAQKYIEQIKNMKEVNLRVSGKVVLASAVLLKMKSKRLIGADISALDKMFQNQDEDEYFEEGEYADGANTFVRRIKRGGYAIIPRTPQPRKRKVSVYDLVNALEKAMEVRERRILRRIPEAKRRLDIPHKRGIDIGDAIVKTYAKIAAFFSAKKGGKLTFQELLPDQNKLSKVYTFIPLLHLTNQRKIDLEQEQDFGEIQIKLLNRRKAQ